MEKNFASEDSKSKEASPARPGRGRAEERIGKGTFTYTYGKKNADSFLYFFDKPVFFHFNDFKVSAPRV